MCKKYFITALAFIISFSLLAQQENTNKKEEDFDYNAIQQLGEVVFTGQYNPQSVDQSVFEVEVISRAEIKRMAGVNLGDVLNQTLNLNIVPNSGTGRSGIQQFGFNSGYVKILVDGIPVVGDQGFGNAIDVSQINLDDIKQIEIVEGAMGVQYGANAVTGVINIITTKSSNYAWEITPYVQEETIGSEYGWFDQGRHIQSLKIEHNFSDHWYASASYTHNDFQGFLGHKYGKNYFNPDNPRNNLRGYEWLPKEQHTVKGLVDFQDDDFRLFYKFEYFNEQTNKYAYSVRPNPNNATQTFDPTASDAIFRTNRWYHHLNASGEIADQLDFNVSVSYQEQTRNIENYTYALNTGEKSNINRHDYNKRKGFFSRGTLSHFFNSPTFDLELGYAVNLDKGFASGLSEQNALADRQYNTLNTYSGFISAEIKATPRLSLRPGVRLMSSTMFAPQYALSFSGKYDFNNGYQLRAIIGSSPKTPTFEQLYFYMVDSNHDVQGNENLSPEYGKSIFLHFKKTFHWHDYAVRYTPKLSAWYLDVDDKIDLIVVNENPLAFKYNNINLFRTWGMAFRNELRYNNLTAALGVAFSGESKVYEAEEKTRDDYLYSIQLNANAAYRVPDWQTTFSVFFKYNGPHYQFANTTDSNGATQIVKRKREGYSWMNASVEKSFFDNKLSITLGARNLLDVVSVNTGNASGTGHTTPTSSVLLGYGRSYFLKLLYNFNF